MNELNEDVLFMIANVSKQSWYQMCTSIPVVGRYSLNREVQKSKKLHFGEKPRFGLFIIPRGSYDIDDVSVICPKCDDLMCESDRDGLSGYSDKLCHLNCNECGSIILCLAQKELEDLIEDEKSIEKCDTCVTCISFEEFNHLLSENPKKQRSFSKALKLYEQDIDLCMSVEDTCYYKVSTIKITHLSLDSEPLDDPPLQPVGTKIPDNGIFEHFRGQCRSCLKPHQGYIFCD